MPLRTRWLVLVACVALPELTLASPCDGVDQTSSSGQAAVLSRDVGKDLGRSQVQVIRSFRMNDWSILEVESPDADEAFVFYSSDPAAARHVTLWSGAARRDEAAEIEKWAVTNAPGIPARLAKCFAWYVTKGCNP